MKIVSEYLVLLYFFLCNISFVRSKTNSKEESYHCEQKAVPNISPAELAATNVTMLMSINERVLLYREMSKVQTYIEFGSGGSTEIACNLPSLGHIVSIDNNKGFLDYLLARSPCFADNIPKNRLVIRYIDTGPVGYLGVPVDVHNRTSWNHYPEAILNRRGPQPQLVLVDGRFRMASGLYALLAMNAEGTLIFHDFFNRSHYYKILQYADIVDCADSLVVLKRKPDIQWLHLMKDIHEFVHNFD